MDKDCTVRRCSYLLFLDGSSTPSVAVHADVKGTDVNFFWQMDYFLRAYETFGDSPPELDSCCIYEDLVPEAVIKKITEGQEEEQHMFCTRNRNTELEVVLSALFAHCTRDELITIQEIDYLGDRYTNISKIQLLGDIYHDSSLCMENSYDIRLTAEKNGSPASVYFFGRPISIREYEDGSKAFLVDPNNSIFASVIKYIQGSCGVVEGAENRLYIGCYPCEEAVDYSRYDSGWYRLVEEEEQHSYVHLFCDRNGDDVTFSVLYNGRLLPKISKTAEQVVFHYTSFYSSPWFHLEDPMLNASRDIIFRNIGGQYQYTTENWNNGAESRFRGVTFTPPQLPDYLDSESADQLCVDYIDALYAAFSGADEYRAPSEKFVFRRSDRKDGLEIEADGFVLTCKIVPATRYQYILEDYRYFFENLYLYVENMEVQRASFTEDGVTAALLPVRDENGRILDNDLVIDIDHNQGTFQELNARRFFENAGTELPENVWFDWTPEIFQNHIKLYQEIKKAIIKTGMRSSSRLLYKWSNNDFAEMEKRLYDEGMIHDPDLVAFAVELHSQYKRTDRIANIAVIGEAGAGKSEMTHRLARAVYGRDVLEASPADLKGPYLGQTRGVVVQKLAEAAKAKKILFIDEAYELMADEYGREAVALLLPLMTGGSNGRKRIDATVKEDAGDRDIKISVDFETGEVIEGKAVTRIEKTVTPIWIAGYEDDIRMMLKENQGLFRRFKRITLASPTTSQLYQELLEKLRAALDCLSREDGTKRSKLLKNAAGMSGEMKADLEHKFNVLLKQFEEHKVLIEKFFRWGAQRQNSKYFAHHAGVDNFLDRCIDGINFGAEKSEQDRTDPITIQIENIITLTKRDIKHQIDTARRGSSGDDADHIEMIFDNETCFDESDDRNDAVREIRAIIETLVHKNEYEKQNITVPKGALLLGPPGTGKTYIARAMAGELQKRFADTAGDKRVGFMSLSAPELTSKPVSFIGSVFDKAEEYDVCVIFIDEVDAIAKSRFQNEYYSHFIELIKQMDGIEQRSNIFVLAATNAAELLDPAFTRAGRIDKMLHLSLPDHKSRAVHAEKNITTRCGALKNFGQKGENGAINLSQDEQKAIHTLAETVSSLTGGFTIQDIENVINTAFVMYKRGKVCESSVLETGNPELDSLSRNISEVVEQMKVGYSHPKGEETFIVKENDQSRSATAIHEVGHALVSLLCGRDFGKITSLPRGNALGYVTHSDSVIWTKADFEDQIRITMGGRLAEELVYGKDHISMGASSDMVNATNRARYMVECIGFADEFEFMALRQTAARDLGLSRYVCSEAFREQSDQAVNALLKRLYQETRELLADKKELIIALAEEVFRRETMNGDDFKAFYHQKIRA